ncbi:Pantothenate synthetase [Caldalkalibacillus thermarum TA2.A1]|uniref:Pantothenate synthetase n=1 Tax=Caldalkalibacillus thermarum (strain TA2.A1) TaxID=986075 RepID=F5L8W2_CALTT|nr:pantoate--beta-alanine ligase [Caldalkalibacillus thermarum]EGL82244.1 Pantothenate synthetase [Caldalkalibacillus thermarum TA2.A1]QZT32741.1 pantoate--beta-alanine ligase [Caldalkalibacillus thermarum TA2.A1]
MKVIPSIAQWRAEYSQLKKEDFQCKIGFVPTMGYLHDGHLSLVKEARKECDVVVMSIFVNPLQFGENEDFDRYPRDLERDKALAREHGVDYLFVPDVNEMYPQHPLTSVSVSTITEVMCGASRPGHFTGVATVVTKLFNIIQPDYAYFGLKDAQQVAVIQQMVKDLNIPVTIKPCPIVREKDGLAMSSRNVYLSEEERKQALYLYKSLREAKALVEGGERNTDRIKTRMENMLRSQPLIEIDYIDIRSFPELKSLESLHGLKGQVIVAVAVKIGRTRLIDNVIIDMEGGN